jgi:transposase
MITGIHLDYKELRGISPKAARRAILQVLKSVDGNVTEAARLLHTTRRTIYKALKKDETGNLDDSSTAPRTIHNRTAKEVEGKVIEIKQKTRYGPIRIADELLEQHGITLSTHTIRNIVRRHKKSLKPRKHKPHKKGPRQFVDWYSAKPFEVVQIDLKHVIDQKALSMEQINHIRAQDLPLYQWGALDVNSRFKLIAYSGEKSWTNGLTWFLWVTSWIRSHGITGEIVYTVDHGEEFGGQSWLKIVELRKLLSGFGVRLIQNRIKHPEENSQLERSHRTDDDEFYIPRILDIPDRQTFYKEALNYIYYYNNVRKHSGINRQTPFQHLYSQMPEIDDRIRIVPPVFLDNISVDLGPWSGYHVLAQNQSYANIRYYVIS